jgi:excisionase family DNA binding protein
MMHIDPNSDTDTIDTGGPEWITMPEAARALNVSRQCTDQLARAGRLGDYRPAGRGGGRTLVRRSAVEAELARRAAANDLRAEVRYIAASDPDLSDRAIADMLTADGRPIARRTVAKHRGAAKGGAL